MKKVEVSYTMLANPITGRKPARNPALSDHIISSMGEVDVVGVQKTGTPISPFSRVMVKEPKTGITTDIPLRFISQFHDILPQLQRMAMA